MWKNILDNDDHKVLASMFKKRLIKNFKLEIINKVMPIKKARLKKWKQRADYQATLMMVQNEQNEEQPDQESSSSCDEGCTHHLEDYLERSEAVIIDIIEDFPNAITEGEILDKLIEEAK